MADAPWLVACKRLAVGQTARFRCCGRTPAAVLYNKPDSWGMFCHRCKSSPYERKQYVSLVQPEILPRVLPAPAHLIRVSQATPETRAHVYSFMVSKGLMPDMLEDALWSEELKRLVFQTGQGTYLARAMYEHQQPKWLMLGGAQSYAIAPARVGIAQTNAHTTHSAQTAVAAPAKTLDAAADAGLVVLTEDYLSARKVQWTSERYSPQATVLAVALLGTRLQLALKSKLVQANKPVLLMLDGDAAGDAGTARISKELRPFVPVRSYQLPGLDPKDMQVHQILEGLNV
ncbi:gp13 [Shigella phage Buco]|uniref:Putative DNA primase n=1 Tax=Shigella phage Buco TaxID=2530183 RepID=A0A482JJL9_9CAUD|nr:gp13 [Shigella phage Buco]QBP32913.1 putative DNA primase [Shigella phage Buco]